MDMISRNAEAIMAEQGQTRSWRSDLAELRDTQGVEIRALRERLERTAEELSMITNLSVSVSEASGKVGAEVQSLRANLSEEQYKITGLANRVGEAWESGLSQGAEARKLQEKIEDMARQLLSVTLQSDKLVQESAEVKAELRRTKTEEVSSRGLVSDDLGQFRTRLESMEAAVSQCRTALQPTDVETLLARAGLDKIRVEMSDLSKGTKAYQKDLLSYKMETSQKLQDLSGSLKVAGQSSGTRSGVSEARAVTDAFGTFESRLLALELHIREAQDTASPPVRPVIQEGSGGSGVMEGNLKDLVESTSLLESKMEHLERLTSEVLTTRDRANEAFIKALEAKKTGLLLSFGVQGA